MKLAALVAEALLTSAEGAEVFGGLGSYIVVEIEIDSGAVSCEELACALGGPGGDENVGRVHKPVRPLAPASCLREEMYSFTYASEHHLPSFWRRRCVCRGLHRYTQPQTRLESSCWR